MVIVGVRMSGRESDKDHPYGHERMECVASIVLATPFRDAVRLPERLAAVHPYLDIHQRKDEERQK